MRFTQTRTTCKLSPESVDYVSEDVQKFLSDLGAQKKNIIETRLTIEEILLDYIDRYGDRKAFVYSKSNFLGKPYITISIEGEMFNPLEKEGDDEFGNWSSSLIQNADYVPSYSFFKGINTITMRFSHKGINPIIKLFLAIMVALLVSLLRFVLPEESILFIEENLLSPLYEAFVGLMATVEIPLVFLSIACGIIGIGDSMVFGRIGRKMVLRFLAVILFLTAVSSVVFALLFTSPMGAGDAGISFKVGIDMLLGIIPHSLLDPFSTGNIMQVILIAVVVSISIVILGNKAKTISNIINEGNRLIVYITGLISKLLPVFIFIILLNMIWSGNLHLFISMWRPIVAFIAVIFIYYIIMLIRVSTKEEVNPILLIKKMLPTFLIGFGTASSVAANGECAESLHKRMGVNKRFVEFGQPVGSVIFMPATAINLAVCSIYMASYYEVKVSLLWYMIAILICTFVAVATPAVPGGAVAAYTIIFAQLGVPAEAVAIVIAIDILFDFFGTAFDGAFLQFELIRQADANKMLDYDTLRN